jgi:hypothetical protein
MVNPVLTGNPNMSTQRLILLPVLFATALFFGQDVVATEEAEYRIIRSDGALEMREYAPSIVAETVVEGEFEKAGNRAFRSLFRYIDGHNFNREEIAMTAPVSQERHSEKIAMTAPVSQQSREAGWAISFMMPSTYTMNTIPQPLDPDVKIREIPAYRAAVVRYSGFWSEKKYLESLEELRRWMAGEGLVASGNPVWARYNAPFTPWFMRRNEILQPVEQLPPQPDEKQL